MMENKYKEGDFVFSKFNPDQKLVVRRYLSRMYYCRHADNQSGGDLVYFERELISKPNEENASPNL